MTRYLAVLAMIVASGCASDPLALPESPCAERRCSQPPQEVVASARALGMNLLWEISLECTDHDLRMLAGFVRISARRKISMAVWGRDSELARNAIVRALDQPNVRSTNLELAFFGNTADVPDVRGAVLARGGVYIETPMPLNNTLAQDVDQNGQRLAAVASPCQADQKDHAKQTP